MNLISIAVPSQTYMYNDWYILSIGLDPAGPLWEEYQRGLDKNAATFVDIIVTDGKGRGHNGSLRVAGHTCFYPNGGGDQPGCDDTEATGDYLELMNKTQNDP